MTNIDAIIGRIYCRSIDENNVEKFRIGRVESEDNTKWFIIHKLDSNNKMLMDDESTQKLNEEDFKKFIESCDIEINSKGIVSISNAISAVTDTGDVVRDVIMIYFPNNKMTRVPDLDQPYIVARQGLDDFFSNYFSIGYGRQVGLCISLDTIPNGYSLSDFLANDGITSSYLTHVYVTDDSDSLSYLLGNKESSDILEELYTAHANFLKKSKSFFPKEYTAYKKNKPVDGYNFTLKEFIENVFLEDLYSSLGITKVDFELKEGEMISGENKLLLSVLYGGIRIDKAIPIKFEFDISMKAIKMKYLFVVDSKNELYLIPYTESNNEIPVGLYEKIAEEQYNIIRERLRHCIGAYDKE